MSASSPCWRLQLGPLTAVLAATVLVLLGERFRVFQKENLELGHLRSSKAGRCSQHEAGAASAAWRLVADGQQFSPGERSFYASWIDKDLSRWDETGITHQVCTSAAI